LSLSAVRGPASSAHNLYRETADSALWRERRAELRRFGAEPAQEIRGRPTKRDGRRLRDLPSD
jgi:ribosome-associated heat shock protein Hsp15